jgi:hypothetical protein
MKFSYFDDDLRKLFVYFPAIALASSRVSTNIRIPMIIARDPRAYLRMKTEH